MAIGKGLELRSTKLKASPSGSAPSSPRWSRTMLGMLLMPSKNATCEDPEILQRFCLGRWHIPQPQGAIHHFPAWSYGLRLGGADPCHNFFTLSCKPPRRTHRPKKPAEPCHLQKAEMPFRHSQTKHPPHHSCASRSCPSMSVTHCPVFC